MMSVITPYRIHEKISSAIYIRRQSLLDELSILTKGIESVSGFREDEQWIPNANDWFLFYVQDRWVGSDDGWMDGHRNRSSRRLLD